MQHAFGRLARWAAPGLAAAGCTAHLGGPAAGSWPTTTARFAGGGSSPVAGPSSAVADAGVVADCHDAEPRSLSTEPSSIVLLCASGGSQIVGLTWADWTATAAVGHGTYRENQCVPDCAAGSSRSTRSRSRSSGSSHPPTDRGSAG